MHTAITIGVVNIIGTKVYVSVFRSFVSLTICYAHLELVIIHCGFCFSSLGKTKVVYRAFQPLWFAKCK